MGDRSLVASSLVASLPGGEVTGNRLINYLTRTSMNFANFNLRPLVAL